MKATIIQMDKIFPAFVSSRKSIILLQNNFSFNKKEKYVFDFQGIDFISRSFADELLKFVEKGDISYEIKNMNSTIKDLFNVVKKTQNPSERHFETITITSFKRGIKLKEFLATF